MDNLYPKTLSGNVRMNVGMSLEEWKMEVDDTINNIEDTINKTSLNNSIWSGNNLLGSTDTVEPSKKLTDCKNGWVLVFSYIYGTNSYNYQYLPKEHLNVAQSARGVKFVLGAPDNAIVQKYVYISNDNLKGHATNTTDVNGKLTLINIIEY